MRNLLLLFLLLAGAQAPAASKVIMVTGYWPPTNEMLRRLSPDPAKNPEGWLGADWQGSGYDVYAFFPEFASGQDRMGAGDFQVDYADTFNDFMRLTAELNPVAIIGFGRGAGPWEIEAKMLPAHREKFESGNIPSQAGVKIQYPIPAELKKELTYSSSLPMNHIAQRVNALERQGLYARIDQAGADFIQCAFLSTLLGWYHDAHADPRDPAHNRMAGFIHVGGYLNIADVEAALHETLIAVIHELDGSDLPMLEPPY